MSTNHSNVLTQAFDNYITKKYGKSVPPSPYITPFGIRTLDTLLGGGILSSAPLCISSTPETGKTTMSLQFVAAFQRAHERCVTVYINIEEAAGDPEKDNVKIEITQDISQRIKTFGIDVARFLNKPVELNVKEIFELIKDLVSIKIKLQEKDRVEYKLLIIWDSLAATGSSKDHAAEDPKEIIGFKAREITFQLSKIKSTLSMERVTLVFIDQVRSNIQIESPWAKAGQEKSVGVFGNYKSATSVASLQHHIRQWLFLSRGAVFKPSEPLGIDGLISSPFIQ